MTYCFRWKLLLPPSKRLGIDVSELTVFEDDGVRVWLGALNFKKGTDEREVLAETGEMVLRGSGYASKDEANAAASRWRSVMEVALARRNVQADFGDRAPQGDGFTKAGLQWMEQRSGFRLLNDRHGLAVFECEPPPQFGGLGVRPVVSTNANRLEQAIEAAQALTEPNTATQSLAFNLYSASGFQDSPDTRLILLVMAVESLLNLQPRPESSLAHVEQLIALTKAVDLPDAERSSLLASLNWLRLQSISQAGKALASSLGERSYMDMSPPKFFAHCYELRSRLVHGEQPRPDRLEVNVAGAQLERFVSDLLSRELLHTVPD